MSRIHLVSFERSGTVGGRQPLLCATIIQSCYQLESQLSSYLNTSLCQLMSLNYLQYVRTSGSENILYVIVETKTREC